LEFLFCSEQPSIWGVRFFFSAMLCGSALLLPAAFSYPLLFTEISFNLWV
jgi:hypothetical protein